MKVTDFMNRSSFALVLISLLLFASCGSKKKTVSGGALDNKTQIELVSDIVAKELKYNAISGKMNLEILPGGSNSGLKTGASVKIIHDEIIQISIRPSLGFVGFEAVRITLTPDSVVIVDRINRRYAVENIGKFGQSQGTYFNYYNLQALLTNALFLPGKKSVVPEEYFEFDLSKTSDMYMLKTADKSGITYNFAIDASDRIVSTLIYSPQKNATMQWSYKEFIKDGSYVYPTDITAKIDIQKNRFDLNMTFSKLDINVKTDIDKSIPGKYEKVSLADLISILMKLK